MKCVIAPFASLHGFSDMDFLAPTSLHYRFFSFLRTAQYLAHFCHYAR